MQQQVVYLPRLESSSQCAMTALARSSSAMRDRQKRVGQTLCDRKRRRRGGRVQGPDVQVQNQTRKCCVLMLLMTRGRVAACVVAAAGEARRTCDGH